MFPSVRQFGIIDNIEKIARREDTKDGGSVNVLPEYDVVIVGGGNLLLFFSLSLFLPFLRSFVRSILRSFVLSLFLKQNKTNYSNYIY